MGLAGSKLGNYELLAEVARGSTTDLILARATGMGGFERHVVIKRVREERLGDAQFVEAFLTEARLAGTLHHHNIVQVQDIAQDGNVPFFAMEYVHGADLRALLAHVHKAGTWVPIQHVLTIGLAIAAALHHAHEQRTPDGKPLNIVHRDVTPANILVGYDGNVKVGDFGMAKAAITNVTQVGTRKGKAPYMAPEQCAGQRVDRRTDVFALGIVLHELATARRLFKGANDHDTMTMIVHGSVPPPLTVRDDLPRELSSVIMKALARLPADRYQSAAELAGALETYASAAGIAPSTTALATYIKQQLGERKEPWLPGGSVRPVSPVDFDGGQPGVASPAGEAVPPARTPTMPAAIAQASQPVVPGEDHDENEPTATGGPSQKKAEEPFDAEATKPKAAEPKKLDINAFAPKKLEPKATSAPRKDATPIPSLVKKAPPPPDPAAPEKPLEVTPSRKLAATTPSKKVPLTDLSAGWETKVDQNAPSRAKELDAKVVDDEMKSESSTAELTDDQIQTNLATVGLASRPTPQPVARVALVKKAVKTPPPQPKMPDEDLAIPLEPPPPRGDEVPTEKLGPEEMRLAREEKERAQAAGKPPKQRAKSVTSETSPVAGGEIVAPEKVKGGDRTELVAPLPLDLASPASASLGAPKPRRKKTMLLAGIGGVAVFAAVAMFVAFSGGSSHASQAATATASNDSEARPLAKHADDDKEATGGHLTWNGVLDAGGGSAEPAKQDPPNPEPPTPEPPKEEPPAPEPPKEEPSTPGPPKQEPVKVIEPPPAPKAHPVAKKPPAPKPHPVAKKPPVKKATKPDKTVKYDPNSLFLGK